MRIGQAMILVVVLAGDCALARELITFSGPSALPEWCLLVILPMANILGIAAYRLATLEEPESRPFWRGFLGVGAAAVVASSLVAWFAPDVVAYPVRAVLYPVFVGMGSPEILRPIFLVVTGGLMLGPHLLLAIGGGLALRRLRAAVRSVG
jgi:hypothetical protein